MNLAKLRVDHVRPAAIAGALTAFYALYGGVPKPNAVRLALPILIESGWPGMYPQSDVLVHSLQASGFHLYVLMGRLASLGVPINAMFYVGLLVSIFALVWLAFLMAQYITDSPVLATWSVVVLMAMPAPRGSLVWSDLPWSDFVSGSLAYPLVMLAVWCGWHRRWIAGGILTGVVCNIHPSMGSIAAALLAASGVWSWREDRASIVRGWIAAAVTAAPNVYLMASRLLVAKPGGISGAGFIDIMTPFQGHLHLRDHVESGLGFYTGLLLLAVMGLGGIPRDRRRQVIGALVTLHLIVIAYVIGVEVLHSTFIGLFFWFRAMSFLKLFAIPVGLMLVVRERRALGPVRGGTVVALLSGAACVNNMIAAEGFLFIAIATVFWQRRTIGLRALAAAFVALAVTSIVSIGWRRLGIPVAPPAVLYLLAAVRGAWPLLALPAAWRFAANSQASAPPSPETSRAWTAGLAAFLILAVALRHPYDLAASTFLPESLPRIRARIVMDAPGGEMAGLNSWAQRETPRSALFSLPPELEASVEFRARARRGVFVTLGDLAILSYSPATFLDALRRAEMAGVRVVNRRPDASPYATLDAPAVDRLRLAGVTHIVFRRTAAPPRAMPMVYADADWVVYALAQTP